MWGHVKNLWERNVHSSQAPTFMQSEMKLCINFAYFLAHKMIHIFLKLCTNLIRNNDISDGFIKKFCETWKFGTSKQCRNCSYAENIMVIHKPMRYDIHLFGLFYFYSHLLSLFIFKWLLCSWNILSHIIVINSSFCEHFYRKKRIVHFLIVIRRHHEPVPCKVLQSQYNSIKCFSLGV